MSRNSCSVCARPLPGPGDETFLWTDGTWTATTRGALPGWANLVANRHVEGFWSFDDVQRATFGNALATVGAAVKVASEAERVYIYWMGEHNIHFQLHIAPRVSEEDPRGAALHSVLMPLAGIEGWLNVASPGDTAERAHHIRRLLAD